MTESQAYIAFNLMQNMGPRHLDELLARHGSAVAAWEAIPEHPAFDGREVDWQRELKRAAELGVTLLTPVDADYPPSLMEVPAHPLCLYVKGSVAALAKPAVALVGTRRSTAYGRDTAERFAHDLAQDGWVIVSGLALGIDAAAHRGALAAGGVTVGVIGSALDRFYPEQNLELAREIVAHGGAVVSQFPFGRECDQHTFPVRNQVVAAMVRGVVAVEAPSRSGTLITTSLAADLGVTVMAVPARVDNPMSAGCLKLIRDGARLVRSAEDVEEELSELIPRSQLAPSAAAADSPALPRRPRLERVRPEVTLEESLVIRHLDADGVSLERLLALTGLPPAKLNALCMTLRIKGRLRYLPGNRVALAGSGN